MPLHPTTCPLDCPDACGVLVETAPDATFLRVRGNPEHSYSRGSLCGKTSIYGELVTSPGRLRHPLLRARDGSFAAVSWERALEVVAERVRPLAGEDILALSYAGCMGLVNRFYPERVMHALGACETDGSICDSSATLGYQLVLGHVVGPDVETLGDADALVLWGVDAKRTHQHLLPRVRAVCRRGAPVLAIDVYRTDTLRQVEQWGGRGLVIRPGSDAALALGLARVAFERGLADEAFLATECVGADAFRASVLSGNELADVVRVTGVGAGEIEELLRALSAAERPFLKVGVGWTRRRNGGMSMRAVCSLAAVLGIADRLHYESSDHFDLDTAVVARPDLRPAGAPRRVISQIGLGRELEAGRFRAVFVWGHNPAVTIPDSGRVRAGLARQDLFLVVHEQFMTETAELADVVLPATTFVEQTDLYRSYGHRVLQLGRKAVAAPAEQRSNVEAFAALARALGLAREVWDRDEERLARELLETARERIGPDDVRRVLAGEPVKLRPRVFADRGTPSGKVELESERALALGEPALATYVPDDGAGGRGRFQLVCAPSVATHNSTFSHSARHVARMGRPRCFVHPGDARELGVVAGGRVRLSNEQGRVTLAAELSSDVPRGVLRVDGMPRAADVPEGVGINALVPGEAADLGGGNVLYSTRVDLEAVED